jgi:hypothetical protein
MKQVTFDGYHAGIRGLSLSRPIRPYLFRRGACLQSMLVDLQTFQPVANLTPPVIAPHPLPDPTR